MGPVDFEEFAKIHKEYFTSKPEQPRDRLVRLIAEAMSERFNDPKNMGNWRAETISRLFAMAQWEMTELCGEIYNQKGVIKSRVREEIGDCIAFLAMLLDKIETEER